MSESTSVAPLKRSPFFRSETDLSGPPLTFRPPFSVSLAPDPPPPILREPPGHQEAQAVHSPKEEGRQAQDRGAGARGEGTGGAQPRRPPRRFPRPQLREGTTKHASCAFAGGRVCVSSHPERGVKYSAAGRGFSVISDRLPFFLLATAKALLPCSKASFGAPHPTIPSCAPCFACRLPRQAPSDKARPTASLSPREATCVFRVLGLRAQRNLHDSHSRRSTLERCCFPARKPSLIGSRRTAFSPGQGFARGLECKSRCAYRQLRTPATRTCGAPRRRAR